MKELSIEEKAKRYDEALARANEMIKAMTNIGGVAKVDDIQHLFPELKESEDERKEYKDFVEEDPVYNKLVNGIVGKAIAKHFFELGMAVSNKAQKGENI